VIKSSVTVSLVPEARGGPFIFWDDLEKACADAAEIGYDAVEIFPPGPEVLSEEKVLPLLREFNLKVAAVGTGAGWVKHRFSLTSADKAVREKGKTFIREIISKAAELHAPVIIGSMQGRFEGEVTKEQALEWLAEALKELSDFAETRGTFVLYEFLNRYETNLINRVEEAANYLDQHKLSKVQVLADLFHMNIEEASIPEAIENACGKIGHVHFADSNRRPAGFGHTDMHSAVATLKRCGYEGYLSAEALPYPDSYAAAKQTMKAFREHVR
jgi:sugar phosphate isomerase/epimerase